MEQTTFGLRTDAQGRVETRRQPLTPVGETSLRTRQPQWEQEEERSVLALPLSYQNFEILFEGLAPSGHPWLEEDREIVRQTLEQLALALQDAYLFTSTQQALAEVERLYKATSQLLEGTTFAQALQVLAEHTALKQAHSLYLYLPSTRFAASDSDAEETESEVVQELQARWPTDAALEVPSTIACSAEQAHAARLWWALAPDDPRLPAALREALQAHPEVRAVSVAPLSVGQDLVGSLVALFTTPPPPQLPPREQRILLTVLRQVAGYVRSLALQEDLRVTLELTNRLYRIALGLSQAESFDDIMQVMWEYTPLGRGALSTSCVLFEPAMTPEQSPQWLVTASVVADGKPVPTRWPRLPFAPSFEAALTTEGPYLVEDREGEEHLRQLFVQNKPYLLQDMDTDVVLSRSFLDEYRRFIPARSGILLPMRVGDSVVGMITAAYPDARSWTREELQVLQVAAAQAAVRARSLYLLQVSERRARQLETASVIARDIGRTLSLETLLHRAVDLIRERFGFYHATVFLLDERGEYAEARAATGEAGRVMLRSGHKLRVGSKSVVGQTAARGEPVVVNDVRANPVHRPNPLLPDTQAEAAFPLRVGDRVIGVLDVQATTTYAFTPEDVQVLQLLADQLAVAVENARAYELARRALQDMRRADELKSQFLASMSHELRTPLNSIIGFSRIILKGIDGPITDLQRQDLEAIFNAGQHLLGLINDILDLSKIEAGKMELNFAEVDVAQVIRDVLTTTQALVKDKPVRLETDLAPDLPPLRVDPKRFRQILLNLLSNAAKFTKEGYIRVRAYQEVDPLTAYSEVIVAVEDTGPGIAPEHVERLFQPFYQVDSSLTREVGGTGLGLAITRNLVELHGGRIWVESEPGRGSTFYVAFPVTPTDAAAGGEDFLLVYDVDPDALRIMRRQFAVKGYRVVQVKHLAELIARAQALRPLAVFVNPFLERQMGVEALLELKKRSETRYLPTYFLAIDPEREEVFNTRWQVMLTKPLTREDVDYLRSLVGDRQGPWVLLDRHPQHLEHMMELLREAGVEDIRPWRADEAEQPPALQPLPAVFVWDMLAPMPAHAFRHTLQQEVQQGGPYLAVGLLDAQMDAETWAQFEERLRELKAVCTYPLNEALTYLEGALYHLAARRAAAEAD
ncbi:MAG: GAF domain-containing sensor histidine kinase [Chloroflexi bacterium]|nr:GAF domain-containing sensor histidine kinase [Chloroflexota bacterium]